MTTILFAPLQGYTDHVYRSIHARLFKGVDAYYTPFIRIEKGEPRRQDVARLQSPLNEGINTVPQIIFSDADEFRRLADIVVEAGYNEIDLNIGCPFPMQTRRGRGCALMSHPETLAAVAEQMRQMPQIKFSLKMRCGEVGADVHEHTDLYIQSARGVGGFRLSLLIVQVVQHIAVALQVRA